MGCFRSVAASILLLSALTVLPIMAQADQPDREGGEFRGCDPEDTLALPASVISQLPSAFTANFTIHVEWDWGRDPNYDDFENEWPWPASTIITAARMIMPDPSDEEYYEDEHSSIANRVAWYFGNDLNASYGVLWMGPSPEEDYDDHWDIYLCISGGQGSSAEDEYDRMFLGLPAEAWRRTAEKLAEDQFAHEFEHLIAWSRPEGGAGAISGEFDPQGAEYIAGWFWDAPNPQEDYDADDFRFNTALYAEDYMDRCTGIIGRHRYYSMLAPYTMERYDNGEYTCSECSGKSDFLFRWIRYTTGGVTPGTMEALRGMIFLDDYDEYFGTVASAAARFRDFWRNYFCSLWLNSEEPGVDPVSRTLCYTCSERSPRCHGPVLPTPPSSNMSWSS
jgi:hypothetical protein